MQKFDQALVTKTIVKFFSENKQSITLVYKETDDNFDAYSGYG
jgi:hypothetical protein